MSFDTPQLDSLVQDKTVISVKGLEKTFRMYKRPQDRLKQMVFPKFKVAGKPKDYFDSFTALKNIDLTLGRGETVGIVGRNGSGKSTLLQIICGTLQPTAGEVSVNGRVAALLELGAGFNPEFTGRENVYLNGAIIGLSKDEIDTRFEQIASFANIGAFIDQPTKSYSSGMYVRLAFSVAIHAEPDILIVDEALSVGDEAFQRKCFARIEDMQANGTTILFVSHSAQAVIELCDRAVLLDAGEILISGTPKHVVGQYQRLVNLTGEQAQTARSAIKLMNTQEEPSSVPASSTAETSGAKDLNAGLSSDPSWYDPDLISASRVSYETQGAEIVEPRIYNGANKQVNHIAVGRRYRVSYTVEFHKRVNKLLFGCLFKTVSGIELAGANNIRVSEQQIKNAKAGDHIKVDIEFNCHLMPGTYFLTIGLMADVDGDFVFLHRTVDALAVHVMEGTNEAAYDVGLLALGTKMRTSFIDKN